MKRKVLLLIAVALSAGISATSAMDVKAADSEIFVPDTYLRQVICDTLGKAYDSAITEEEMLSITELNSDSLPLIESPAEDLKDFNRGIESLEGLQYAKNLTSLDLSENRISDLGPLAELKNLSYLELDRNNIRDLTPLAGLDSLEHLNIYNNFLESVEPLSELYNLQFLDMHYANREGTVIDHTPLSSLTNLTYLSVESNYLTDISFLEPLADSGNLKTILVRANSITDFSPLSDLLYKEYSQMYPNGMPGFESPESTDIMVGTNNQSPWGETLEVNAPASGGEIRIALPEIKGFEQVEEYYAFFMSMMEMNTLKQLSLETNDDDIHISYDDSTNEAVFEFPQNIVGSSKDINTRLLLGIYGTDFEAQFPIHISQPTRLSATLNIENGTKNLLFINSQEEDCISSDYVTGTVLNADGTPCVLEDVQITFEGTCEFMNRYSQDMFSAKDIQIDGNTFRFRVAQDRTKGFDSNFLLNPTITFRLSGDNTDYTLERGSLKIHNVYVSNESPVIPEAGLSFDVSSAKDGSYTSEIFTLGFPSTQRTIQSVTVIDEDGSRLTPILTEDRTGLTVAVSGKEALKKNYTISLSFYPLTEDIWDAPVELSFQPKLIYSAVNPAIESQLSLSPLSLKTGEATNLTLTYQDTSCSSFTAVPQNPELLDISGTTAKGLRAGTVDIHISDITIPYPVDGEIMDVSYLPGRTFTAVIREDSSSEDNINIDQTPETPASSGNTDTADTQTAPQTGDTHIVICWLFIALLASLGIAVTVKKKYSK